MTNTDAVLMEKIKSEWQAEISAAVLTTSVSEPFLAALVANESGGDEKAERFEPAVFATLAEVILGKRKAYTPAGIQHPLGQVELLDYIEPAGVSDFIDCLGRLAELATSRNLTQIMGWHFVEMGHAMPGPMLASSVYLTFSTELLVYFANKYALDLSKDFPALFRCWNTGKPDGQTFDPHYVSNGLNRIDLYSGLIRT